MATVRAYKEKDKERVQDICLVNAGCSGASEDTKKYILCMKGVEKTRQMQ